MASQFYVFTITIPANNGYAQAPEQVEARVIPHVKQVESYAEMKQVSSQVWELTTPAFTADFVVNLLERHYGFQAAENGVTYR